MAWIEGVRGVLLDVDGTLIEGDRPIAGAASALQRLRDAGIACRVTTNTTRRPRSAVAEALQAAGLAVAEHEILNPAVLARGRIVESGRLRAALMVPEASKRDFDGVEPVSESPDWVVIGDLGRQFTWETINRAFGWLREGAGFLALQKNRYWHAGDEGLLIDAGAFIAGLEYAAGVEAEVVGKPSRGFFALALARLGCAASETLVVGDDVTTDGAGAKVAGCFAATVRTGKFRDGDPEHAGFTPDLLLASIADLSP